MTVVNVLMVDDHQMVREALVPYVKRAAENVQVHQAKNVDEACRVAATIERIDLVVLDLYMDGMDGDRGFIAIRQACPGAPIVVLSGSENPTDMRRAINAGVVAYVPKFMLGSALTGALQLALSGEQFFPRSILASVATTPSGVRSDHANAGDDGAIDHHGMTPRQWMVLELIVLGLSNKGIARRLNIEEITVKVHVQAIFRKLGVANRTEAATRSLSRGWFKAAQSDAQQTLL